MRTDLVLAGQQSDHRPRGLRRRADAAPAPGRVLVAETALAPSAVGVLHRLEPGDRRAESRARWIDANRAQTRKRRASAVNIVDAPTPPPRAVVLLLALEPSDRAARDRMLGAVADRGHHLEHPAGQVGTGRVGGRLGVVGEGRVVEPGRIVVDIEGGETAVLRLHAHHPVRAAADRTLARGGIVGGGVREHHQDDRGVVHVGIPVVEKLEGPAAGLQVGPFNRPIAALQDLMVDQPLRRVAQRRMLRRKAGIDQRLGRERGVPVGRNAGLEENRVALIPDELTRRVERFFDYRMVIAIAEPLERHRAQ